MGSTAAEQARLAWRMQLHSALRTALACGIVGCATIYGPEPFTSQIKFTAFSYLTTMIIVSNATLGDTIGGCWYALCATAQVVPIAMLGWWAIAQFRDDGMLDIATTAMIVAALAFVVALPDCTHLTTKKIAFGQIVLVCTDAVTSQDASVRFMHPLYVAASTALGAVASTMALSLPYPDSASFKIQKLCHAYGDNASQRMNLYLRAFASRDCRAKKRLVSEAKPMEESGAKFLHNIRILQEGLQWERRLWCRYSKCNVVEQLEAMELQLRRMTYALDSSPDCPLQMVNHETLSNVLQEFSIQIEQKIRCPSSFSQSITQAESRKVDDMPSLPLEQMVPTANKHGWVFFFLSCIDMLLTDGYAQPRQLQTQTEKPANSSIVTAWKERRLEFAFKCSLSLGLAVLFGLIFDKRNGCWAGLTIANSIVTGKQAIFTMANIRAQGTAIGSAYGVICCFLFHYEVLKLLALLPWLIFSSILKYSKMYGQSGGISAAIGALLILGRQNYGAPNDFALVRMTEVFIGLSTFLAVELCMQPIRAAELTKNHLQTTLSSFLDCIKETRNFMAHRNHALPILVELRNKHRNINSLVRELMKSVTEAELEPDFWYVSFRASSYHKLVESLSKMADLLYFILRDFEILTELLESSTVIKEFYQQMYDELESCQGIISSSLEYLKKGHPVERDRLTDLEIGKVNLISEQAVPDRSNKENSTGLEEERITYCLSTAGFCFSTMKKEIEEMATRIREIN